MNSYLSVRYVLAAVAILVLLAQAPFYFAAGLVAPAWAVVLLVVVWLGLVGLGFAWFRRRPWWVLPLPVVAAAIWFGGISAGEAFLGWTG
ncbi:MAG: hypothetical protein AVDCRST_MAG61-1593 [uncultured Friedmanniella sp.]|uniref:Uncharacterized protein n=1 Tax=uncultured Friedmanniella sp. TaxID=335381 RepID=A0A6J4KLA0_9ACTN|nr:hypothetical protein [uncultured Friedmanniella sp.]CAA9309140.1 MAG: hypothetical protein AVDCRST_MAG61-1593 [uncultured Friedmanniella sp.]